MGIMLGDLLTGYAAERDGTACDQWSANYKFQDYVDWEQNQLPSKSNWTRYGFWRQYLAGVPCQMQWPVEDCPIGRPEEREAAAPLTVDVSTDLGLKLLGLAAEQHTSLHQVLLAAFNLLLHHHLSQQDFVIGCGMARRQHAELDPSVGPYEVTVPVRSQLDATDSFIDHLARTAGRFEDAARNRSFPLGHLKRLLAHGADEETAEFCRVSFLMDDVPTLDTIGAETALVGATPHATSIAGMHIESLPCSPARRGHDLSLWMAEQCGTISGRWDFDEKILSRRTVEALNRRFLQLLETTVRHPTANVMTLDAADSTGRTAQPSRESDRRISASSPSEKGEATRKSPATTTASRPHATWTTSENANHVVQLPAVEVLEKSVPIDPVAEAELDPRIVPPADRSYDFNRVNRIFLTGGTGFVGAHLLDGLLKATNAEIICLVRAPSRAEGMQRIKKNLARYRLTLDGNEHRIRPILGDLTRPLLGLGQAEFEWLSREVDVIYHNGADVNLILGYRDLRGVNVCGSHEVLRLGLRNRVKPTHVVSSYAVHTSHDYEAGTHVSEDEPLPRFESLANGYSQTKWVVEQFVAEARRRGLPVTIYRPGNITGHSVTGDSNTGDIMHTLIAAMLHTGTIPETDLVVDLSPVDFVARAIVEISRKQDCLGATFHLMNHEPLRAGMMADWLRKMGLPIEPTSLSEWRRRLAGLAESVPAEVLGLLSEILTGGSDDRTDEAVPAAFQLTFDTSRCREALADTNVACHPVNEALLGIYADYLRGVGFFDLVQRGEIAAFVGAT
jgi:thioester reductase-like protein